MRKRKMSSTFKEGTVCQKCGDIGYAEHLIFCSQCKLSAEHRYCMDVIPNCNNREVLWSCYGCLPPIKFDKPAAVTAVIPLKKRQRSPTKGSSCIKRCLHSSSEILGERNICGSHKKRLHLVDKNASSPHISCNGETEREPNFLLKKQQRELNIKSVDKKISSNSVMEMEGERKIKRKHRRKLILEDEILSDEEMKPDNVGRVSEHHAADKAFHLEEVPVVNNCVLLSVDRESEHDNDRQTCEIAQSEEQVTANGDQDVFLNEWIALDKYSQMCGDRETKNVAVSDVFSVGNQNMLSEHLAAEKVLHLEEVQVVNNQLLSFDKKSEHDNGGHVCEIGHIKEQVASKNDHDISFNERIELDMNFQVCGDEKTENVYVSEVLAVSNDNQGTECLAVGKVLHLEEVPVISKGHPLSSHKENEHQNGRHTCGIAQSKEQVVANCNCDVSFNDWIKFDKNSHMYGNVVLPVSNDNQICEDQDIDRITEDHLYVYSEPIADPVWRGCFAIDPINHYRIAAHLSTKACDKVWEETRKLARVLTLEKLTRDRAWPSRFSKCPPTDDNIALYFFPECQRDEVMFDKLVDELNERDLIFRATLNSSELLIFSSLVLPKNYWFFHGRLYMWGIFRSRQMDQLKLTSGGSSTIKDGHRNPVGEDPLLLSWNPVMTGIGGGHIASSDGDRSQSVSEGSVENLCKRESSSRESTNGSPFPLLSACDKHESDSTFSLRRKSHDWKSGEESHSSELLPSSLYDNFVFDGHGKTESWNYDSTIEDCDVSHNSNANTVLTLFPLRGGDMAVVNKLDRHSVVNLELGLGCALRKDGDKKLLVV